MPPRTLSDPWPYAGTDVPTDWLYRNAANGGPTSAEYAEVIVPEQARLLKEEYKARLIVVVLKSGDEENIARQGRIDYFKGVITPEFTCNKRTTNPPTPAPAFRCFPNENLQCKTVFCDEVGIPASQKNKTQCYFARNAVS